MSTFYLKLIPESIELNHFIYEEDNKNITNNTTKFIIIESSPMYKSLLGYDIVFENKGIRVDLPKNISVVLRDNHKGENINQFRYFTGFDDPEDDFTTPTSLELAIDYPKEEFDNIWNIFASEKKKNISIKASINLESHTSGCEEIFSVQDGESINMHSFSIIIKK